ncbi:MAG: serine hydrolase [Sulfolobales archaeon]|nr:serine hydrolase [Sulfolobales archaeon]MDW8083157.1 serine hydrolase [Sulfolobales archaeon]
MEFTKLDSFVIEKMSQTKIPGLSLAVVKSGEIVYSRSYGFKDVERGLPPTSKTVYGIGSVTKSFTALAILKLAGEGKLSVDDDVSKYVPLKLEAMGEPIRIHHLLTHTSGIPALAYAEAFIRSSLGLDHTWLPLSTAEDVVAFMSDYSSWVHSKPGAKYFYLNEGYVLLGYVISKVSGMRYEDYVREKILKPLGMYRTYFEEYGVSKDPDVAVPYIVDRDGHHVRSKFPYGITADGGILSNCEDMSKYISMLINRGSLEGIEIVSPNSIELAERKYVNIPASLFGDDSYGYGLVVTDNFLNRRLIRHSGSVLVYTAFMGYLPSDKVGVIVLANAAGYPLSFIGMYALALTLGYNPEESLHFIKQDRVIEKLTGNYETYRGTYRVSVKRAGDFLLMEYKDRYRDIQVPLVPVEISDNYMKYYTLSYGSRVEVEFTVDGDRVTMIYERYKFVKRSS